MNWYYAQGEQRMGPVTEAELEALIAAGTITETTLVWTEGMANWTPLKEARAAGAAPTGAPPGWIRCSATGRFFPPEEIIYIDGKPYSAAAKQSVLQGVVETGSLAGADFGRTGPPWEHRAELGFFTALWQTVKGVLFEPTQTFDAMRREGGLNSPLLYNIIPGTIGYLAGLAYGLVFNLGTQSFLPPASRQSFAMQAGFNTILMVTIAILSPLLLTIGSFIVSGVLHLSLMLVGGARQPFETTYRVNCYTYGSTSLFQIVPMCGGFIHLIWFVVAVCIGISRSHEISTGKAVLAVFLPLGLCCVALIVFYGAIIAMVVSTQGTHH